jgi:uncharacterized protein YcfL
MKLILLGTISLFILSGCSSKEFNDGVNSITNDISKVFEESKDSSSN